MMLKHHKGRTTMTERPESPPDGSPVPPSGGRQNRLTMRQHRRRGPSCSEDGTGDPGCYELRKQDTGFGAEYDEDMSSDETTPR